MVRNYMETLVEECLDELLRTDQRYQDICQCEQCKDDIMALALNHIKPFYITCAKGEVFGRYNTLVQQNKADIVREVVAAIELVSKNKRV